MTDDDLADVAHLGEEARKFIEGDVGKSIFARAEQYALDALSALAKADPKEPLGIIRLQERIELARSFPTWFDEIVNIGEQARVAWTQRNPTNESGD